VSASPVAAPGLPAAGGDPSIGHGARAGAAGVAVVAPRVAFHTLLAIDERAAGHPEIANGTAHEAPTLATPPTSGMPVRVAPRSALTDDDDPLDPLHRHRAALRAPAMLSSNHALVPQSLPIGAPPPPHPQLATRRAAASVEELIPLLVRRASWAGDARRGTARLEIGAGELAGATLIVHADEGRVRVRLDVPPGVDVSGWQARICARLSSRSIVTDEVEVA
jgi:hypothetical protein